MTTKQFLILIGLFCFQGSAIEPIYASTRLIFLSMMIASVVVFESYCASYAAFLNVVELSSPFHSVADLYANTDFKVGGLKGTSYKSKLVFSLKQMVESGQVKISWTRFKQKKREVQTKQ